MQAAFGRTAFLPTIIAALLLISLSTTASPSGSAATPPLVKRTKKVPEVQIEVSHLAGKGIPSDGADRGAYAVQPILFVPVDVQPHPYGLAFVDRQMQNLQHWFAEQLGGRTFTLKPAQLVLGWHERAAYFEPCYPPVHDQVCSWGRSSWRRLFQELEQQGYSRSEELITGVFFQGEGLGTALGGSRRFLVDIGVEEIFPDCHEAGCGFNIGLGGTAHELGHALGIAWHPEEGEDAAFSVMSEGLYRFPKCTFINSRRYPERDLLYDSPFINQSQALSNPGFEECLAGWRITAGAPTCKEDIGRSGTRNLWLSGREAHVISQTFEIDPKQTYDISGWLRARTVPDGGRITVKLLALDAAGQVIETTTLANISQRVGVWQRFGTAATVPAGTAKATIQIETEGTGVAAEMDDFSVLAAVAPPPMPLISGAHNVDQFLDEGLLLSWSPLYTATSFKIQVASDPFFEDILLEDSSSAFTYQIPIDLPLDAYTFWRVRAQNGAGASEWSPPGSIGRAVSGEFFNEEFLGPVLSPAWVIISPAPSSWHVGGFLGHNAGGYLISDGSSGELVAGDEPENMLLRPAPQGDFAVVTMIHHSAEFSTGIKQHGLIISKDAGNDIRLAYEWRNGWRMTLTAQSRGSIKQRTSQPMVNPVGFKIERRGNCYTAFFRPDGVRWEQIGRTFCAVWKDVRTGVFSNMDAAAADESFAAFDWIRVTRPCPILSAAAFPNGSGEIVVQGSTCGHIGQFLEGTPLRLTAQPRPGYRFSHWSGAAGGTDNPLVITAVDNATIVAHFTAVNRVSIMTARLSDRSLYGR